MSLVINIEEKFLSNILEDCMFTSCVKHPTGEALFSDWSANSFMMVVCEKIFSCALDRKFKLNSKYTVLDIQYKLSTDQSEVSVFL